MTRRDFLRFLSASGFMSFGARSTRVLTLSQSAGKPEVQPRDRWAIDRPALAAHGAEDVRFLLVHHSASPNEYDEDDVPGILQGFFDYHTSPEKGWSDIAYNFLIDRFGHTWEGRTGSLDGPVVAYATGGNQGFSQLVCLIGDFTSELPSPEATDSLVSVLAWLADRDNVSTSPGSEVTFASRGSNLWAEGVAVTASTIAGHRDMSITTCPGEILYGYVAGDLAADVNVLRIAATTTTESATTTTATSEVTSTTAAAAFTTTQGPVEPISEGPGDLWLPGLGAGALATGLAWIIRRRSLNRVRKPSHDPNEP